MRILTVVCYYKPAYVYGGPVKSISTMCEALVGLGQEVTVLTTNANGTRRLDVPLGASVNINGVEVVYYPISPGFPSSFFYSPALAKAVKRRVNEFDIVVVEALFTHLMGPATTACRRNRIPYVIPPRGQLLPWSLQQKRLKKQVYLSLVGKYYLNHAAALHCTDPLEAEAIKRLNCRSPTFVIANGIDLSKFSAINERGRIRAEFGIPADSIVLLFMGRLHMKKRPDIAIQAFAKVKSVYLNAYLLMCGPDEEGLSSALQAEANKLGCSDRVIFTGLMSGDKISQLLADVDIFLMPSEPQSENFGMAAVEAMAVGVPILISEGVPVGYWAEKAGAGRMVPCTADAFANALFELLRSHDHLMCMGEHGRELVRQKFDIQVVARQMLRQYESIITSGHPLQAL